MRYFESAIEYDGQEANQIGECARENRVYLVTGVVERDGGTLYCSVRSLDYFSTGFLI